MIGPVILQVVLIFLNAIFASAEIAVISMNENKLRKMAEDGDKRAMKLSSLIEQPARFLATIQVAITLAGLLGSAFAAENFATPLVKVLVGAGITIPQSMLKSISVFLITIVLAYFNLVFGELVPKRIAMKKSESMALGMSGMLYSVSKIFSPIVALLTVSTNFILRCMGIDPNEEEDRISEEEIRMMLIVGKEQGTIDQEETKMIQNVFELDDITVEQICTHRIDVVSLNLSDDLEEWENIINGSRHTYYPVYDENVDNIIGVLNTKDYFRLKDRSKESAIENALDKAYYVLDGMKANVLFQNMKHERIYIAVIIDEYGGLSGIVTLHDIVESLVGDLYEIEEITQPEEIEKIGENQWVIYGTASLSDVAMELGVNLPIDTYDTYSGFVCGVIGRIPSDGETFSCESNGLKIEVMNVKNHRIVETLVELVNS